MRPELSHHVPVPVQGSLRAAGTTTCGTSPRRGATTQVLITSFTSSRHETGILSYYLNVGNYSQPPRPEKASPENKVLPIPWYTAWSCVPRRGQGPIQSWRTRDRLLLGQKSWPGFQELQMVPGSKTSRAQPGRRGTAAGKHTGNQLMLARRQQQAQLAGERHRDPGQRLETTTAQRDPGREARRRVGSWLGALKRLPVFTPGKSLLTNEHLGVGTAIEQRHPRGWAQQGDYQE